MYLVVAPRSKAYGESIGPVHVVEKISLGIPAPAVQPMSKEGVELADA